ncbi:MAG: hypothetical protein JWQ74_3571 [Marmoricola sp.]|nr:hypothetical protein [Marmoricola sp.]
MATVTLKYVEKNTQRDGSARYYLRIKGERVCRLPDDFGSDDFQTAYWAARTKFDSENQPKAPIQMPTLESLVTKAGSFKWLTMEYMRSAAFRELDATTQSKRRPIIEAMWKEPLGPTDPRPFADAPLSRMTSTHIEYLRDQKRETPFAADERLKVLRQVFATKKDGKEITPNIAMMVEPFRQKTDGHHTATPEEIAAFIAHHGVKSKAVLAMSILMFTGIRVSDLSLIGPQHRRKDAFKLRLFKNRNKSPVTLEIPIHPILSGVLAMHKTNALTYLLTDFGKPFSIKGMGNRVSDWFNQAHLPHCTAHSVRKGLATDQAHNGATDSQLEAMFGWKDGKTSKIYTRNANQARLARVAVGQINWDGVGTELLSAEVDRVAACGNGD